MKNIRNKNKKKTFCWGVKIIGVMIVMMVMFIASGPFWVLFYWNLVNFGIFYATETTNGVK